MFPFMSLLRVISGAIDRAKASSIPPYTKTNSLCFVLSSSIPVIQRFSWLQSTKKGRSLPQYFLMTTVRGVFVRHGNEEKTRAEEEHFLNIIPLFIDNPVENFENITPVFDVRVGSPDYSEIVARYYQQYGTVVPQINPESILNERTFRTLMDEIVNNISKIHQAYIQAHQNMIGQIEAALFENSEEHRKALIAHPAVFQREPIQALEKAQTCCCAVGSFETLKLPASVRARVALRSLHYLNTVLSKQAYSPIARMLTTNDTFRRQFIKDIERAEDNGWQIGKETEHVIDDLTRGITAIQRSLKRAHNDRLFHLLQNGYKIPVPTSAAVFLESFVNTFDILQTDPDEIYQSILKIIGLRNGFMAWWITQIAIAQQRLNKIK